MAVKLPYEDPIRKYFVVSDKVYKKALSKAKKKKINILINETLDSL